VQTHGRGPEYEGMIADKDSEIHRYALFGIVDVDGPDNIDEIVNKYPDCRITVEQTFYDWLLYTLVWSRIIDARTITIEFPVPKDSERGKELLEEKKRREKRRRREVEQAKYDDDNPY